MPTVTIETLDTTLRDGAQSLPEKHQFPDGSKNNIARSIAMLGLSSIEAGFAATPSDAEEIAEVAKTVGNTYFQIDTWTSGVQQPTTVSKIPRIAGLSRAVISDIDAAWESVRHATLPTIHTFISTDQAHMQAKFPGKPPNEVLDMGTSAIRHAVDVSEGNARIEFSAEAATTTDLEFLEKAVKEAVQAGADVINVPDTVGRKDPFFMFSLYRQVLDWCQSENANVIVSAHNHNDMGMATSNTLALVCAAMQLSAETNLDITIQTETTICGLGERAGNADYFPTMLAICETKKGNVEVKYSINKKVSIATAQYVMRLTGLVVNRQNPVVGSDVNTHRSGIHSNGIIKGGHEIYTPFNPSDWGHQSDAVHEKGKYQGKTGVAAAQNS